MEIAMRLSRTDARPADNPSQHQLTTIRSVSSEPQVNRPLSGENGLNRPPVPAGETQFRRGSPRLVVVDGSNVGMSHEGSGKVFLVRRLELVTEYFTQLGNEVTVVLPKSRWNRSPPPDRAVLDKLESRQVLVYTPSRRTEDRTWDSYDDRFIIKVFTFVVFTHDSSH